eukprot:TRINITY_DN38967_c0_g1_i2.p1 TRINITY_DN38967_c0_g1~~TRINITY_DN38967_c0_g1_i2.p1  ORF type:complete len:292 (-),score=44.49 TRINITY_DN38967_c0_g1_i2:59-934(-)
MDMFGSFNAYCCGSCTDKKRDEVTIVLEHFPAQGGDDEVPNGTIVAAQVATDEAFPSAHFDRGAESEISASRDHSRASSVPSTGKLVQKDLAAPRVASRNSRNSNGSSTGPRSGTKDAGPGKSADVPKPGNPKAKSKAVVRLRPDPAATCEAVPKRSAADDTKLAEARKLVTEANTLFTKMQLQAAIEKYGAVMELDPKCAQAYVGRGGCRLYRSTRRTFSLCETARKCTCSWRSTTSPFLTSMSSCAWRRRMVRRFAGEATRSSARATRKVQSRTSRLRRSSAIQQPRHC